MRGHLCSISCLVAGAEHCTGAEDSVSLLQLNAAPRSSHTEASVEKAIKNFWRDGGCRVEHKEPAMCAFNTDTHLSHRFEGGSSDQNQQGVQPLVRTTDNSSSIDVWQTSWSTHQGSRRYAKVSGMAMRMGEDLIECRIPADCRAYTYCEVNGKTIGTQNGDIEYESGLYISRSSHNVVCIDSPDGKTSISLQFAGTQITADHYQLGIAKCDRSIQGKAWFNAQVRVEKEIAVTGDDSLCGGPGSKLMKVSESLFSDAGASSLCDIAKYRSTNLMQVGASMKQTPPSDCDDFPPPDEPVSAEESCQSASCSFEKAEEVCGPLEAHDFKYDSCLVDVCAECENAAEQAKLAALDVEEEEVAEPAPICVNKGDTCDLTSACEASVKVDLSSTVQNNLGGQGPGSGDEELRFSKAAIVGGQVIDLVVKVTKGKYKGFGEANGYGTRGAGFGSLSQKSGKSNDFEFSFVDSTSGEAVTVDQISLTLFDLDEGKNGKSRTTVTACGAANAVLTTNTELSLERQGDCFSFASTEWGSAANNPSSPTKITQDQGGRSVELQYSAVSSFTVTIALAKGSGHRNTLFTLGPSLSCLGGDAAAAGDMPLLAQGPIDLTTPSAATCPVFQSARLMNAGSNKVAAIGKGRSVMQAYDDCKQGNPNFNAFEVRMWTPTAEQTKTLVDEYVKGDMLNKPTNDQTRCGEDVVLIQPEHGHFSVWCPPGNYACNIHLWKPCYEIMKTKKLNGKPWVWEDAI